MYINYPDQTKSISIYDTKTNEKCLILAVFGDGGRSQEEINRHKIVMEYQEKVFNKFKIPLNRFYHDFNYSGMGP